MDESSHTTAEIHIVDKNTTFHYSNDKTIENKPHLYKVCSQIHFNKNTTDHIVLTASNSEHLFFVSKKQITLGQESHTKCETQHNNILTTLTSCDCNGKKTHCHVKHTNMNKLVDTDVELATQVDLEEKTLPRFIKLRPGDIRNFKNTKIIKRPNLIKSVISYNTNGSTTETLHENNTVKNDRNSLKTNCDINSFENKQLNIKEDEFLGFESVDVDCLVCNCNAVIKQLGKGKLDQQKNTHRNEELIAAISLVELQDIKKDYENVTNKKHDSTKNNHSKREKNIYQCHHCNYQVYKKRHLELHLRTHIKPYLCTICIEAFSNLNTLQQHMEKLHSNHKGEKLLKCCFCNYRTPFIKRLKYHNRVHDKEMSYHCNKCSFMTLTKASLNRHMHVHDSPKLHECNECGYITTIKDEMNSHMNIHGGKQIFKCELCTFQTSHRGYFLAHRDFHSTYPPKKENPDSETQFKCSSCSFVTLMRSSLLKHVKCCQHELSRQTWELLDFCDRSINEEFQCPYCDYFSFHFDKLKNHAILTHCKK